jgi:hypothetical protein
MNRKSPSGGQPSHKGSILSPKWSAKPRSRGVLGLTLSARPILQQPLNATLGSMTRTL